MTQDLSVSSVTQTWQVARRSGTQKFRSPEGGDADKTVTICRPALRLLARSSHGGLSKQLTLPFGLHSFWVDKEKQLQVRAGRDANSEFEIDLNGAGAFFFSSGREHIVRVNKRKVGWIRLRSDDVVQIDAWTLTVDPGGDSPDDETILSLGTRTLVEGKVDNEHKPRRISGITLLAIVFAGMLCAALVLGYQLAQNKIGESRTPIDVAPLPSKQETPTRAPVTIPPPQGEPVSAEKPGTGKEASAQSFERRDFENIVHQFRSGDKKSACARLETAVKSAKENVWLAKARLFLERRCGNG